MLGRGSFISGVSMTIPRDQFDKGLDDLTFIIAQVQLYSKRISSGQLTTVCSKFGTQELAICETIGV